MVLFKIVEGILHGSKYRYLGASKVSRCIMLAIILGNFNIFKSSKVKEDGE